MRNAREKAGDGGAKAHRGGQGWGSAPGEGLALGVGRETPAGADTGRFGYGGRCRSSDCGSCFLQEVWGRVTSLELGWRAGCGKFEQKKVWIIWECVASLLENPKLAGHCRVTV